MADLCPRCLTHTARKKKNLIARICAECRKTHGWYDQLDQAIMNDVIETDPTTEMAKRMRHIMMLKYLENTIL